MDSSASPPPAGRVQHITWSSKHWEVRNFLGLASEDSDPLHDQQWHQFLDIMEDVYASSKLDSGYPWGEISQAEKATVKNKFLELWHNVDAHWDETRLGAVIDWRLYRLHKWEREKRLRDDRKRLARFAPNAAFDPVRDAARGTAAGRQAGLTATAGPARMNGNGNGSGSASGLTTPTGEVEQTTHNQL